MRDKDQKRIMRNKNQTKIMRKLIRKLQPIAKRFCRNTFKITVILRHSSIFYCTTLTCFSMDFKKNLKYVVIIYGDSHLLGISHILWLATWTWDESAHAFITDLCVSSVIVAQTNFVSVRGRLKFALGTWVVSTRNCC